MFPASWMTRPRPVNISGSAPKGDWTGWINPMVCFRTWPPNDGLPDDGIYDAGRRAGNIQSSTNKRLWMAMQPHKRAGTGWSFRTFTKADGLQDDELTGASASLPNGKLAFGGVNGINIFGPADVLTTGFEPKVLSRTLVNNQVLSPGDGTGVLQKRSNFHRISGWLHLQDILTLEFSSLDPTAPAQNKYRYQMTGVDKDWVESGTRRSATYLHPRRALCI